MPDSPPQVIHMPLEELLDPELSFDCPESAGPNPTAYVHKPVVDQMAEALTFARPFMALTNLDSSQDTITPIDEALAAYREAKR